MLEYAIEDLEGRKFWSKNFTSMDTIREEVPWDKFVQVFNRDYPLPLGCGMEPMKSILAQIPRGIHKPTDRIVNIDYFGKALDWFGPLKSEKHIALKIQQLLEQEWFHGDIDKEESYRRLKSHPPGTFLIRLSISERGRFSVSRVRELDKGKGEVIHEVVQYKDGVFHYNKETFPDLQSVVEKWKPKMKYPCPGSKFSKTIGHVETYDDAYSASRKAPSTTSLPISENSGKDNVSIINFKETIV